MSDQIEVQLTFKKLVFVFMCAVILAGVIFSLGVSVGRKFPNPSGQIASTDDITTATTDVPVTPPLKPSESSPPQALQQRGPNPATVTPPAPVEEPAPAAAT